MSRKTKSWRRLSSKISKKRTVGNAAILSSPTWCRVGEHDIILRVILHTTHTSPVMILHRKNSGSDALKNNCIPYAVKGKGLLETASYLKSIVLASRLVVLANSNTVITFDRINFKWYRSHTSCNNSA